jgi:hypothetical protein
MVCRGIFRLSPNTAATHARTVVAATPETPRENNGGLSCNRILMAAQFTAHPIEVIARKRKPIHLAELGLDFLSIAEKEPVRGAPMQTGLGQDEWSHLSAVAQPAKAEAIPIIPCLTDRDGFRRETGQEL